MLKAVLLHPSYFLTTQSLAAIAQYRDKIVFEKTSKLLNSNIIVAKQYPISTLEKIKKTIHQNKSNKYFFNDDFVSHNYAPNC